jgi:hypothetical protein
MSAKIICAGPGLMTSMMGADPAQTIYAVDTLLRVGVTLTPVAGDPSVDVHPAAVAGQQATVDRERVPRDPGCVT